MARLMSLRDLMAVRPSFQGAQVIERLRLPTERKKRLSHQFRQHELYFDAPYLYFAALQEDRLFLAPC